MLMMAWSAAFTLHVMKIYWGDQGDRVPVRPAGRGLGRRPARSFGPWRRRITPFPPTPIGRTWKPARSPGTDPASPNLRFHDSRYFGSIRKSVGDIPVYPVMSSTSG